MKMKLLAAAVLATGGLAVAPLAHADVIPTPGPIVSGPITFTNFTCSTAGSPGVACGDGSITVNPHTSVNPPDPTTGDPGIRIQGAFSTLGSGDVTIEYDATASGTLFHDASMFFNGTVVTSVSEHIFDLTTGALIGSLLVSNPPPTGLTDDILLTENVSSIRVVKDIGLTFMGPAPATISIVDQQFSTVPEPGSMLLLGTALFGLGLVGWAVRRRDA